LKVKKLVVKKVTKKDGEKISVADPGCLSRIRLFSIPEPGSEFFHPGSRIRIKEFNYFNPKI
jgi:hypothetical protein